MVGETSLLTQSTVEFFVGEIQSTYTQTIVSIMLINNRVMMASASQSYEFSCLTRFEKRLSSCLVFYSKVLA